MGSPLRCFHSTAMALMRRACSVWRREFQYTSAKLNLKVACRLFVCFLGFFLVGGGCILCECMCAHVFDVSRLMERGCVVFHTHTHTHTHTHRKLTPLSRRVTSRSSSPATTSRGKVRNCVSIDPT